MAQPEPWGKPCQSHLLAHAMGCGYEEEETCCRHASISPRNVWNIPLLRPRLQKHAVLLHMIQTYQVLAARQQLRSAALSVPAEQPALETVSEICSVGKGRAALLPSLAISGQKVVDMPWPKCPWLITDEAAPWVPYRSIRNIIQTALQVLLNMLQCSKNTQAGFHRKTF